MSKARSLADLISGGATIEASEIADSTITGGKLASDIVINTTGTITSGGLTVDTSTLHVNSSLNRVGIGTTSPSTLLDVNGTVTATTFVGALTGDVTGNATTATALETARTIAGQSFDGSANITIAATDLSDTDQSLSTTDNVTFNDLVVSGNLTVSGTTTTVNTETINLADNTITLNSNATGSATENGGIEIERGDDTNKTLLWNETSDKWTVGSETFVAGTFEGALTGNVTGNVTGDVTGNADTATALATARTIGGVSFDGTANINLPGVNTTGNQDTSGNAATATALETARTIAGQSFDGSSNITIASTDLSNTSDIVLLTSTQTLTNKTLTSPVISTISNTGTLTLPTSTDTLVGRDTTDTLTNKTLTSPAFSGTATNFTSTGIDDNATSTAITIDSSERVGIGTSSPSEALDVVGNTNITGSITSSSFYSNGGTINSGNNLRFNRIGTQTSGLHWYQTNNNEKEAEIEFSNTENIMITNLTSNNIYLRTNDTPRVAIQGNGDIHFYEDTGTTPTFFWDASTERLGIGTSSPSVALDVVGAITATGNITGTLATAAQPNITSVGTLSSFASTGIDDNATSTAITINSSQNVGIGTSSPEENLDVEGRILISGTDPLLKMERADGFNSDVLKVESATDNLIIGDTSLDEIIFEVDLGEAMRIDSSGNVGIGKAPTTTLDIKAGSPIIQLEDNDAGGAYSQINATGTAGSIIITADVGNAAANTHIALRVDGSERMRIDSSGNVGIGTTSPDSILDLTSTPNNNFIHFNATTGGSNGDIIGGFEVNNTGGTIGKLTVNRESTNSSGYMAFQTGTTEKMRITNSGNVGIGTSSPDCKVHMLENTNNSGSTGLTNGGLRIENTNTTANSWSQIYLKAVTYDAHIRYLNNGLLKFMVDGNTDAMSINNSGNVGIGTSSPSQLLHLEASNVTMRLEDTDASGYSLISTTGTSDLQFKADDGNNDASSKITFDVDGSERMRIDSSGNLLLNTTSQVSSAKLSLNGSIGLDRTSTYNQQWLQFISHTGTINYGTLNFTPLNGQTTAGFRINDSSNNARLVIRGIGDSNESVFNYNGADIDFRVRSSNNLNMLFVDGGNDRVGIGTSSPTQSLDVSGTVKATAFQGDGSALTNLPGGGKVLQVISANDSTTRSTNSTSFTDASSTLTATITPSSTSSKVLIMMSIGTYKKAGGAQFITIYRDSTNLANNDGFVANNGVNNNYSTAVVHLDSPNTTSATTYEFRMRSESSGDTQNINGQGGKSSFIVMEIGA